MSSLEAAVFNVLPASICNVAVLFVTVTPFKSNVLFPVTKRVEFIVKALVDNPEDVKVDRKVDEMGVLLSLRVHPEDMGQIIGKAGSTARSCALGRAPASRTAPVVRRSPAAAIRTD